MAYSALTATVVCVDIGGGVEVKEESQQSTKSTSRVGTARSKKQEHAIVNSTLNAFKNCLSLMLQEQLFNEVKDEFAIVVFGKEVNTNGEDYGKGVQNVHKGARVSDELSTCTKVVRPFERIGWSMVESADSEVIDMGLGKSSFLVGLQRCINLIAADQKRLKSDKRRKISKYNIVCFTSVQQVVTASEAKKIVEQLMGLRIDTKFVIPDEAIVDLKQLEQNINIVRQIMKPLFDCRVNDLDTYLTLTEAEDILKAFTPKMTRQLPWKADFEIGEELTILVDVFAITKEATIKQKFTNYVTGQSGATQPAATRGDGDVVMNEPGVEVHAVTQYYDTTKKRYIPLDETDDTELTRGVKVGRTHVPVNAYEDDRYADLDYTSQRKCFQLLQFAPRSSVVPLYLFDSKFGTRIVMPRKGDAQAATHLQALTLALHRTERVAVVSYGYNARSTPAIVCLIPETHQYSPQRIALMMHLMPYRQDARHTLLDSLRGNAGARLDSVEPDAAIADAMEEYVKTLSLENVASPKYFNIGLASQATGRDVKNSVVQDDALEERLTRLVHHANPQMQKLLKMVSYRALHKNESLPQWTNEEVSSIFALPHDLQANGAKASRLLDKVLDELPEAERTTIVPAKTPAATNGSDAADDDETTKQAVNTSGGKRKAKWSDIYVSEANDFKTLLEEYELTDAQLRKAVDYMCSLIEELAVGTEKDAAHSMPKLTASMHLFRRKAVKHNLFAEFNSFLERFKTLLQLYKLDAVVKEMQKMNVTLLTTAECAGSSVSDKHAKIF